MGVNALALSLPAIIALIFKGGIYVYAHFSKISNRQTQIYLFALFALSIQNISEIAHFNTLINRGVIPNLEVTLFYASTIIALALLFHLALSLAFDGNRHTTIIRRIIVGAYLYAVILELLLIFTSWLIVGFVRFGYSVTRVPGPLYFSFEFYAIGIFLGIIGVLIYGAKNQATRQKRTKASIMLLAIIPMATVLIT